MRAWRERYPIKAQWRRLKDKAARRGIWFCLPYWFFEAWATRHGYCEQTGQLRESLTVDRKENRLGYFPANIQPLSREANIEKFCQFDERRMRAGLSWAA